MKKNTIKMPDSYKYLFTLEDMEAIHDFIKNNEDSVITDAVSILENALTGETLKCTAEWCLNSEAAGRMGSPCLDVCITAYVRYIGESGEEIECISICLTDIWDISGESWDEIHRRAYTRRFVQKK